MIWLTNMRRKITKYYSPLPDHIGIEVFNGWLSYSGYEEIGCYRNSRPHSEVSFAYQNKLGQDFEVCGFFIKKIDFLK